MKAMQFITTYCLILIQKMKVYASDENPHQKNVFFEFSQQSFPNDEDIHCFNVFLKNLSVENTRKITSDLIQYELEDIKRRDNDTKPIKNTKLREIKREILEISDLISTANTNIQEKEENLSVSGIFNSFSTLMSDQRYSQSNSTENCESCDVLSELKELNQNFQENNVLKAYQNFEINGISKVLIKNHDKMDELYMLIFVITTILQFEERMTEKENLDKPKNYLQRTNQALKCSWDESSESSDEKIQKFDYDSIENCKKFVDDCMEFIEKIKNHLYFLNNLNLKKDLAFRANLNYFYYTIWDKLENFVFDINNEKLFYENLVDG